VSPSRLLTAKHYQSSMRFAAFNCAHSHTDGFHVSRFGHVQRVLNEHWTGRDDADKTSAHFSRPEKDSVHLLAASAVRTTRLRRNHNSYTRAYGDTT
jgi:hypothetical protein